MIWLGPGPTISSHNHCNNMSSICATTNKNINHLLTTLWLCWESVPLLSYYQRLLGIEQSHRQKGAATTKKKIIIIITRRRRRRRKRRKFNSRFVFMQMSVMRYAHAHEIGMSLEGHSKKFWFCGHKSPKFVQTVLITSLELPLVKAQQTISWQFFPMSFSYHS